MDFRLFGPFEVWHDGAWVDPGDRQQRLVLVILLLNANRVVSKDHLQEYVWRGQEHPRSDLITSYTARLRRIFRDISDVSIEKTPTGYVLRADENLIDIRRFRRLCEQARQAADARLYREALDLWRGPFLSDLDVDRVGGPSVVPPDDLRIDALVDLADLELAAGRHREIRDRLRPVWEEDHTQQRLAVPLMRALIAAGDHVRAVDVFHQTREALDEFGMHVNRELREMMRLAQYGDRHTTLPPRSTEFIGRTHELTQIESIAATALEDTPAVLWISGAPGIGKTTLAVTAAHRLAEMFRDGQLFVDLSGFTANVAPVTPAAALERLLTDLGVPPEAIPPDTPGRAEMYRRILTDTRTLIVLDNAASEAQVQLLLGSRLTLVTSREQGALVATDHVRLDSLAPLEAVELFRDLVPTERVHGHADEVREIVARCGHVPLLIHLVAAQFRRHLRWPLSHVLELLRAASPVSPETTFPAHAMVACTVSYDQLTDRQQEMFQVFALAPGLDLSVRGAAALLGVSAADGLLEDLHRVSLLEESAPGRFQMLDPLREYVLAAHPPADPDAAVDRLLDFYLVAATRAAQAAYPLDWRPPVNATSPAAPTFTTEPDASAWLEQERRNLVAAVHYAADHHRPDHCWRLAVLLWRYFYLKGHQRDWTETLQRAATVLESIDDTRGRAMVLLRLSGARRRSGALTEARVLAEQALPLWQSLEDIRGTADTHTAIATYAYNIGDFTTATQHFDQAIDGYQQLGDERGQGNALDLLGVVSELRGDYTTAEQQHLAAQALLRHVGHPMLGHALDNLGCARQRLGRLDEALANHTEARDLAAQFGDRAGEAYALNNIGNTHRLAGNLEQAVAHQQQARRVADLVVDPNLRTQLYLDRGETAWAADDDRAALHAYRAALDLAAGTGERVQSARANLRIAQVLHKTGHHAPAHWQDALTEFTDLDLPEATTVREELATFRCDCARSAT